MNFKKFANFRKQMSRLNNDVHIPFIYIEIHPKLTALYNTFGIKNFSFPGGSMV